MQSCDKFQAVLWIRIRPDRYHFGGCGSVQRTVSNSIKCKAKLNFFYRILQLSVQIMENYDAVEKDNKTMLTGTAVNERHKIV